MTRHTVVVGHRGWPLRYPENTLIGFLAATEVTNRVEMDVRRSADGKLMLSHDHEMKGHVVAETPWSKLAELDLGDGHKPALLDEALAALPDVSVQIEIKNWPGTPGYEPDHRIALEAAERARPGDIVTGFNWETIARVRDVFPDVATGIAIGVPLSIEEAVKHCLDVGHGALVPEESLVVDMVDAEIEVFPWTVNDVTRAAELVELGVTGIITDDPGLMARQPWSDR